MPSSTHPGSAGPGPGWEAFCARAIDLPALGMRIDPSRMGFSSDSLAALRAPLGRALERMAELEGGAIANPDERRPVGHYWLRAPESAADPGIADAIRQAQAQVKRFAARIHAGEIRPAQASPSSRFRHFLLIGIGGSALGPQLLDGALANAASPTQAHFLDNTDPDGIARTLGSLGAALAETLVVVVSKSGGTIETRNGMLEVEAALSRAGLKLGPQAVAITLRDSRLDYLAREQGFLDVFPIWEWVGGRFSITSAVGLVPAALQGLDVDAFLEGARVMDALTRDADIERNPAALLAGCWHLAGEGRGARDMVVLPYRDCLLLFSRYLQQLVMESLGKEQNLQGRAVHQGIVVYGNKGATDQHAFVQQLREGPDDCFVTFIQTRLDRMPRPAAAEAAPGIGVEVEPGITSGDYLLGFLLGTREALTEKGRRSLMITLPDVSERSLGALIALYERSVGFYADLIGINAYHQPGVEAGKRAAARAIEIQTRVPAALAAASGPLSAPELAARLTPRADPETVFHLLEHLAANGRIRAIPAGGWWETRFSVR
jgi:glucose-6-phosphate isomerase